MAKQGMEGGGGGEGQEVREERGEMEMYKIRLAFLLEKYASVERGDLLFPVCM